MNINYQKKLEELVEKLDYTPRLLLHSCCAPCSSRCIEYLSNYFDITVIYYNPNISPIEEYEKRKAEQIKFISEFNSINKLDFIDVGYDYNDFLSIAKGLEHVPEGGERCFKCYRMRLEKTAQVARDNNYDFFGTTLTVSPYKNSQVLNKIGEELSHQYGVKYLYSDFKKNNGYKRSIELSREYNLYRQDYCGCIYSKIERNEKIEKCEIL
ncbi:MAG: epoxyqueuosine reductase QueH [Bacilli bacterium]|nr:epoxyqueuosine reductase QueH [Bacilli bacterium]